MPILSIIAIYIVGATCCTAILDTIFFLVSYKVKFTLWGAIKLMVEPHKIPVPRGFPLFSIYFGIMTSWVGFVIGVGILVGIKVKEIVVQTKNKIKREGR